MLRSRSARRVAAAAGLQRAWRASGLTRAHDGGALVGQRRTTMSAGARRAASGLVAAEIALAVVLLIGAGLTLRSFANLIAVDPGFTPTACSPCRSALPAGRYAEQRARSARLSAHLRRARGAARGRRRSARRRSRR